MHHAQYTLTSREVLKDWPTISICTFQDTRYVTVKQKIEIFMTLHQVHSKRHSETQEIEIFMILHQVQLDDDSMRVLKNEASIFPIDLTEEQ